MKKITILLALALVFQVGFAQEETDEKKKKPKSDVVTVFDKVDWKVTGGFFGPQAKVSKVNEDYTLDLGARMGMIINRKFALGLAGYGQLTDASFNTTMVRNGVETIEPVKIRSAYGGLFGEYILFSKKSIHFTIPVMVGVGYYTIYEENNSFDYWDDEYWDEWDEIEGSTAFVFEPGINLELNLTKFMRFHAGASYKLVSGTNLRHLEDKDLTDLSFTAGFTFGFF